MAIVEYDDWGVYCRTKQNRHLNQGFLPDPDELAARCNDVRWMTACGFPDEFISSVMVSESPSVDFVERFVLKYGVPETIRRLTPLLEPWIG